MASAKTPDLVDLTKENKDRSGSAEKNKKIKQMRLPFKKINADEYKINLQESLEKAKTTNDDSKKRKISTDSVDEETNAGTKTPDNSKAKTGSARKKPKTDAEVLIVETKPISNEDGKRKISTGSADKETNSGNKTPDNSKAKTSSARKKAKLDVKPKVSKNESKPKSNDDTVAKPENEPSAIQNVKNGGAKEEVVIDQKEPERKPEVDANLTPKVKVSTPKETPRIENTPFKTPEAKSRSAKDYNLISPMEKNLTSSLEKKLTPKQLARRELQDKARQEKEKQKEDARLAREAAKEKERMEKEAQKEQERLEREKIKKEELDEKERLKKEKEAQKEQERLEREKKKKEELDEKERLKKEKEEERLKKKKEKDDLKDQEKQMKEEQARKKKEEAEDKERQEKAKAAKVKNSFANFFVKKDVTPKDSSIATATQVSKNGLNQFQIQNHMKMAPLIRRDDFDKAGLDSVINSVTGKKSVAHAFDLRCATLKSGRSKPRSQGKTWPYARKSDGEDDVQILEEDDDDEIGDEFVENEQEPKSKATVLAPGTCKVYKKAKFLSFHDNQRPAYFGTWSKKSSKVSARLPFGKDTDLFDYDYDSDDDWEEEEQGESLSDEEKDMEEDEKEDGKDVDEQDDDGFFVGHGVLDKNELKGGSDCEGDEEDQFDEELEMKKQKLKAQQFEDEYKNKKPKKLKPRVFGCFWSDPNKERNDVDQIAYDQAVIILKNFKAVSLFNNNGIKNLIPTAISNPPKSDVNDPSPGNSAEAANKVKPLKQVPDEAVPELISLVHANTNNKNFLAKEFGEFWHKKHELVKIPIKKITVKIQEIAEYQKSEALSRKAWMVKDQFLKQYGILEPDIPNKWNYTLEQPGKKTTVAAGGTTPGTPVCNKGAAGQSKQAPAPKPERLDTPKVEKTPKSVASPASLITKFLVKPKEVDAAKGEQKQEILKTSSPKPVDAVGKSAPATPTAIKAITPRRILPTKVVSTPKEQTASPSTPSANPMSKFLIKPKNAAVGKSAPVAAAATTAKAITPRRIQPTKVVPTPKENAISPSTSSANPMTSGTIPVVDLAENAKK